ncbi:unnamed protein product [Blepharisma stoltei]|uniref:Activator of basal transcription 1 n=1 Tax=Blepharisma stoltei TaxID=1481888 RepID=A0AAU9IL05_9CILI|nr:unnamed protein product [Blepharisma stoltei]
MQTLIINMSSTSPVRGVIYLSRIPPYMGKSKLRKLFANYGEIDRIYLTPEPVANYEKRLKAGGNKRRCYVEGWIEYLNKKDAKMVALKFNNATTGGKKRHNFYRDDVWNIRYLPKFTWEHLEHKIELDKQLAEQQVRSEVTLARKANKFFMQQLDKAREIEGIKKKKKQKKEESEEKPIRFFKQKDPIEGN